MLQDVYWHMVSLEKLLHWLTDRKRLARCLHQPKGFKREAQNFPEHDSVLSALHQIFLQSPKTMLAACFESLSSGSGELYDSAFEALDSFISPPECLQSMYKTNSSQPASLSDSDDSNKLQWRQDERLLEWLIPTAERLQGNLAVTCRSECLKILLRLKLPLQVGDVCVAHKWLCKYS